MKDHLFQDQPAQDRPQLLSDNCTAHEPQLIQIFFSDEEPEEMKTDFADLSIESQAVEDQLRELSKELRAKIKQLSVKKRELIHLLKNKYREETQTVYLFADHDANQMLTYNREGELIARRSLRPSERQKTIDFNQKTA